MRNRIIILLLGLIILAACGSGGGGNGGGGSTTTNTPPVATTYTITASAGANGAVTPSGAATVSQGASQSYTITPNNGYAIATLVIDGVTVATSSTYTFTNVHANHTISATFSAAAPGGIVLSLAPARTSGVAPLAVFFDASGTTDTGVTTRPFHDLEYTWDFGDPGSGTWDNGAQPGVNSKNSATGPVAAHVFETPGTYTVTLTVFDGTNTAATNTTITVQDPDTVFAGSNTICIGATALPTAGAGGCPAGAITVQQSNFATAINTYTLTGRRVLFKRGDTFTAPTTGSLTRTGPGILGAFGSGAAPKVEMTGDTAILNLSSSATPTVKDWRIMDFEFDGLSKPNSFGISTGGGFNQLTVLRVNAHHINMGITINGGVLDYINASATTKHTLYDGIFIVESTFWRMYVFAKHLAILGGALGNPLNDGAVGSLTHILRTPVIYRGVISNTTFSRNVGLAIKMHSPTWCDAGSPAGICANPNWCADPANSASYPALCAGMSTTYTYTTNTTPFDAGAQVNGGYTEHVVVSDNKFIGGNGVWMVAIGAQNTTSDERLRNIIVERNWFVNSTSSESALVVRSTDVTVRNNIADMTNSGRFLRIQTDGVEPTANNVAVYNTTGYSSLSGGASFIRVDGYSTNVTVQNNLAYSPNTTGTDAIELSNGFTASGFIQSNNSTDAQMKNTFPGWVSATPAAPADFSLAAGSYAREAGFAVPVWSDFFRTSRPQNGVMDMGAVERP